MTLFKKSVNASALYLALSASLVAFVHAAPVETVYGKHYQPVASVAQAQSQIVFYREADQQPGSANVYIDGEFQSALLPNAFTTFCLAPGNHSVGAFVKDAPMYAGKRAQPFRTALQGGNTYFIKVGDGLSGMPVSVTRADAERALKTMRQQAHTLSRASSVEACQYIGQAEKQYKDYSLSSDVLFAFGKSDRANITRNGHAAIRDLVQQIRRENTTLRNVQVIGHTDQIGSAAANDALGQRRAETIRLLMVQAGIPARDITAASAGMSEPLVHDCYGSKAEQISCYAPNRRVAIRVDGSSEVQE
ncbi:OmpA family protein [Pantoea sp. B9002]|uniref:OmpA family protein n=1 Tax=Pantoea sp. B9002 TaxID=2726979 RepID=UPI0015A44589|nr:OmpA family protein [Pantoea sp. B9002]NWA63129.1 OmpA family protein [Pantoea sp. B9002]